MKKAASFILAVLMILSSFGFALSVRASDKPTISVGSVKGEKGDSVTVTVSISGNPGVNALVLTPEYDKTRLELTGVSMNSGMGGSFFFAKRIVWGDLYGDSTYNGEFLTLTFRVLDDADDGDAAVTLSYSYGDICNYAEQPVDFEIISGKVTVSSFVYIQGDANGDGRVNSTDSKILKKRISGVAVEYVFENLDLNGDGRINATDSRLFKKLLTR